MFKNNQKPKKTKCKHFRWLRGVLFGGFIATLLTCLFTPKSGDQLRKKILKVKTSSAKKSRVLFKNSKQHTKSFIKQAKLLAKNISNELQDFKKGILDEKD